MRDQTPIDEELLKQEYEILERSNLDPNQPNLNPKVKERAKILLRLTLEIEQEVETKQNMVQGSMQHWRKKMLECFINGKKWQYLEDEENWKLIEKRLLEMRRANQETARSVFEREDEGGYALRMQHKFTGVGMLQEIHLVHRVRYSLKKRSTGRDQFVAKSRCDWE